jgi:hypothetical protein
VRLELLAYNPLCITNNQRTLVINFHQDFMVSMLNSLFQGQADWGLTYWPNHTGKTQLSNQEEEIEVPLSF